MDWGLKRFRLKLGVELHTYKPGVIDDFDDFRQNAVGRYPGK